MNRTIKNMLHIRLTYLGEVIGAGFASGKELLQYFVSFSQHGIWRIALASVLFMLGGIVLLQFGSALVGALLFASFFTITLNIEVATDSSVTLLTLFNNINPTLGLVMSLITFGMIYNTAIGTFYALAKRVSKRQPQHFARNMILLVAVGFCLSFIGFETLVGYLTYQSDSTDLLRFFPVKMGKFLRSIPTKKS